MKARQRALDVAQRFYQDTKNQIQNGAVAPVELPRADAEVAARRQDLSIAVATIRQQEASLKDQLVRNPDPQIEAAEIVTLDRIDVPDQDDLPPMRELVAKAMTQRADVALSKLRDQNADISSVGTADALKPNGIIYGRYYDRGQAGTPNIANGQAPNPYFVGAYGAALGQVFRHNFPNEYIGFYFQTPLNNRVAQADYGVEQLQLKQGDVSGQRDKNAILVDISNQVIALRQARARYRTAVDSRKLAEQLLESEKNKFSFGAGSIGAVIIAERNVVTAETSLISTLSVFAHARTNLDKALGQTLDANHVSLDDALSGRVDRESKIPENAEVPRK